MRREDVQRLTAFVAAVDELHQRAMERVLGRRGDKHPNPQAAWTVRPWWDSRVDRIDRDWLLDTRTRGIFESQLPELVHALSVVDDQLRPSGPGREATGRAMVDEAARLRRAWATRARTIAVTETTRNLSQAEYRKALLDPDAMKLWFSERDSKVRESHQEADNGVPVQLGTPFRVGGHPMMFPGDPLGPPEETVNCRCELKIVGGRS